MSWPHTPSQQVLVPGLMALFLGAGVPLAGWAQTPWVPAQQDDHIAAQSPTGERPNDDEQARREAVMAGAPPSAMTMVGGSATLIAPLPASRSTTAAMAEARTKEQEADAHFLAGRWREACEKYREATIIGGDDSILLERVAQCHERAGRTASALAVYYVLEERGRKFAADRASDMESRVPRVRLEPPEGAEEHGMVVLFDGGVVPQSLWREPLMAEPGFHRIEVKAPARWGRRTEVTLPASSDVVTVRIQPLPLAMQRIDVVDTPSAAPAILMGVATAGLLGASIYTGVRSLDFRNQYHDANGNPNFADQQLSVLKVRDDARFYGNLATGLGAAALVTGALTFYLWPSAEDEGDAEQAEPNALWWSPSPSGVAVGGAF